MSMTLTLWKGPVVDDPDEAARLLEPYYERSDDSAFEPSPDIAAVSNELLRRLPDLGNGPWADELPLEAVERVLLLNPETGWKWTSSTSAGSAIRSKRACRDLIVTSFSETSTGVRMLDGAQRSTHG